MWHFPSARFAPFCTPDTRSFIHTARYVDGRSEHDACGIRDETTETANSWRKQCWELCQNCAKTLSNCDVGAYFEREADSPKLLETLEGESKGRNRWNAGSCLQSRRTVCEGYNRKVPEERSQLCICYTSRCAELRHLLVVVWTPLAQTRKA